VVLELSPHASLTDVLIDDFSLSQALEPEVTDCR
jgi:hypothetical protein